MTQLSDLRVNDLALTQVVAGYQNAGYAADVLFPTVPVTRAAGRYPVWDEAALVEYWTARALRAGMGEISAALTTRSFDCQDHALKHPVDRREIEEAAGGLDPLARAAIVVREALLLGRERAAAAIATDSSNYATGLYSTPATKWDQPGGEPVSDVQSAKDAVRELIGKEPNTILFGAAAWSALLKNEDLKGRIQYVEKAGIGAIRAALAFIFGVDTVGIGQAIYKADIDASALNIWDDTVVIAYIPPVELYDKGYPSYGYSLQRKGYPLVSRWQEEGGALTYVGCEDCFSLISPMQNCDGKQIGGYLLMSVDS